MKKKVIAIVQARMDSRRLPGKVMAPLAGTTMIEVLLQRLGKASSINSIIVATTKDRIDDPLAALLKKRGIAVFRGNSNDVLDRYFKSAMKLKADIVVRITGDCPLVDSSLVDSLVANYLKGYADYVSNINPPTFPDGLDVEVFSFQALFYANQNAKSQADREHVTPFLRKCGQIKKRNVKNPTDLSQERWTVDEPNDLSVIRKIFEFFAPTWKLHEAIKSCRWDRYII
jgi:spore coat polysaccharide biosynthesis protein SpsF (cytidylyltransferase family)